MIRAKIAERQEAFPHARVLTRCGGSCALFRRGTKRRRNEKNDLGWEATTFSTPITAPEAGLTRVATWNLRECPSPGYAKGDEGQAMRNASAFLRTQTPVARTTTFLIFDFTHADSQMAQSRP